MIDTGSTGLRIISSVLSVGSALPQQTDANGNPVVECAQFADGFSWGPLKIADARMAGKQANSLPIQVIGDPAFPVIPAACLGTGRSRNTVRTLGANAILGVGAFRQDCGSACEQSAAPGFYYVCPAAGCQPAAIPLASQLQNPVSLFAGDNNGVIVQLPAVPPTGLASVNGSLVFGIGTESNNGLGGATVFTLNPNTGQFTTFYKGLNLTRSFIDSGSNAFFFRDAGIPAGCSTAPGFYCPASTLLLTATIQGTNGITANIDFNVANADSLVGGGSGLTAFNNLGSPIASFATFDWGLPFFFGRNVFVAIEGANVAGGPPGPFIAF
jgi:hypothetical protein